MNDLREKSRTLLYVVGFTLIVLSVLWMAQSAQSEKPIHLPSESTTP